MDLRILLSFCLLYTFGIALLCESLFIRLCSVEVYLISQRRAMKSEFCLLVVLDIKQI